MSLLIALYLLLVIALPLALSAAVSYRTLPETRNCPLCGEETVRIRSRTLHWASRLLRHRELQARWCTGCRWQGVIRLPRFAPHPGLELPRRPRSIAVAPGRSGEAVSLRDLDVDGSPWRVLLQCWCESQQWYGRLLFIAPTGRLWVDTVEPFSGSSLREVMGKALALPDRTLACRLKELISD